MRWLAAAGSALLVWFSIHDPGLVRPSLPLSLAACACGGMAAWLFTTALFYRRKR